MTAYRTFFKSIKNHGLAFLLFLLVWMILSILIPQDIPSLIQTLSNYSEFISADFWLEDVVASLLRTLLGFLLGFAIGSAIGIVSFFYGIHEYINTVLILFHISPGIIIGIILLGIFGISSLVPIILILFLLIPLISINTSNALIKRNLYVEDYIRAMGGQSRNILLDSYLPSLSGSIKSNFTLGFGLSIKIVILGEFIGCMNGIGYRLNVAYVYLNMQEVFFYLFLILFIMLIFQIIFSFFYIFFLDKWNYHHG